MALKKKGGGKLSRSEVVTVRLDPKLRFAAELVARKQRRTLSSLIEWAIEKAVATEVINPDPITGEGDTAIQALAKIWDVAEGDRFVKFAEKYPELLNFDEEYLWKIIKETPYFFENVFIDNHSPPPNISWHKVSENISFKRVQEQWKLLNKIVAGDENQDSLPELPKDELIPLDIKELKKI